MASRLFPSTATLPEPVPEGRIAAKPPLRQRSVENAERYRAACVVVQPPGAVDLLLHPLAACRNHVWRDEDGQLGLAVDEVPALEQLAENGDVAEERQLRDLLVLAVVVEAAE